MERPDWAPIASTSVREKILIPASAAALLSRARLGIASRFASIQRVEGDDNLHGRDARRQLQQGGDMRQRAHDAAELAMVDDILRRLGAEGLVERYRPEGLAKPRQALVAQG